jgi:hypothetical protein
MIINHKYKFIFVHIPKAAGTTVTQHLSQFSTYADQEIGGTAFGEAIQPAFSARFGLRKHSTAEQIRNVIGPDTWQDFFRFSISRNPFSRLQSIFAFLKHWPGAAPKVRAQIETCNSFRDFLDSEIWESHSGPDRMFEPQVNWILQQKDSSILVNRTGKVEEFDTFFPEVCAYLGLRSINSRPQKANQSPAYEKFRGWTNSDVERIIARYRMDFEVFEYPKAPPL